MTELISEKERLIRAVKWISDHNRHDPAGVQEAAMRYDLSPTDEEFLLAHFVVREKEVHCPEKLLGLIKVPAEDHPSGFRHFFYMRWWLLPLFIALLIVIWLLFGQTSGVCR